ncbi:MAG: sodium:solute symporter family protein [bacterium]
MHWIDYSLIVVYLVLLMGLGLHHRLKRSHTSVDLIVGGRTLTLPAFVASLVSTWYGGILGVGEYSYSYGISNWLVFGLPYYLAAFLFAMFLARRARRSRVLTIPERLAQTYDRRTALAGSIIIYLMTVPGAYILMLGVLGEQLFGWPLAIGILAGTLFSIVYVYTGGFRAVVRTDLFQFALMFAGFAVLLGILVTQYGGWQYLRSGLPSDHLTWHGGNSGWYVAVWYVIALATIIEPAFHQRCYAARSEEVARNGIFISIACWAVFDFMTTSCGLYARVLMPELADPVASYPALALQVLPVGLLGLFALALLATVMSTIDSYSFLAATTFGYDIMPALKNSSRDHVTFWTRIGLLLSTIIAVVVALYFRSVVDIWHAFGSIGTPALLIPVFTSFVGRRRMPPTVALVSIVVSGLTAAIWYGSQYWTGSGSYWLELEPVFPGLVMSLALYLIGSRRVLARVGWPR